ncbi:cAMP-dependent protein kinase catalytic subunit [Batrachochytrium dendrobatidis]|nr:cAMP-dependent protein kinase catalytic subunit [Batrachochytrium dendrobatidis]
MLLSVPNMSSVQIPHGSMKNNQPVSNDHLIHSASLGTLVINSKIGAGSSAGVYTAHSLNDPSQVYAVKRLPVRISKDPTTGEVSSRQVSEAIRTEIRAMCDLADCPLVVKLYDVVESPHHINIVMEHCTTDLLNALSEYNESNGAAGTVLARTLILQMMDAVIDSHARGIYHRDLKPENLLVSRSQGTLKICDFGLATYQRQSLQFGCGSNRYMSPECARPVQVTVPSSSDKNRLKVKLLPYDCALGDTWSVGILMLNILTAKNPWEMADAQTDVSYRAYLDNPDILANWFNLAPEMATVIRGLLHPDPALRMSLPQARFSVANIPLVPSFSAPVSTADTRTIDSTSIHTLDSSACSEEKHTVDRHTEREDTCESTQASSDTCKLSCHSCIQCQQSQSICIPSTPQTTPLRGPVIHSGCVSKLSASQQRCNSPLVRRIPWHF